ncbi:MAG: DMT family protein [Bacteroidales bacterium]|nr:DMT family protein [Bacteroidales bacterium]
MKGLQSVLLLVISNCFMFFAWYGNLKFQSMPAFSKLSLPVIILLSWLVAGLEYCFMIPANRIGYTGNGGPFNLWQLKVIQEALSLTIFTILTLLCFKNEHLSLNHLIGFSLLILAVFFLFKE